MQGRALLKATNMLFLCTFFGISDVFFIEAEGLFRGAWTKGENYEKKNAYRCVAFDFDAVLLRTEK